jgi:hypothetical protein
VNTLFGREWHARRLAHRLQVQSREAGWATDRIAATSLREQAQTVPHYRLRLRVRYVRWVASTDPLVDLYRHAADAEMERRLRPWFHVIRPVHTGMKAGPLPGQSRKLP